MKYGYIYESIDKRNGIPYVGKNAGSVFNPNYRGSGIIVTRIIKKYGNDIFTTEVIDWAESKEELNRKEKAYIKAYRLIYGKDALYNIADGGDGGATTTGMKLGPCSEERKIKMKIASTGKHPSEKTRALWSKQRKGRKLGPCPEERKARIRATLTGREERPHTEEELIKMRKPHGPQSEEQKKAKRGRVWVYNSELRIEKTIRSEEIQKYLEGGYRLGREPMSEEHKVAHREAALRGGPISEETRNKHRGPRSPYKTRKDKGIKKGPHSEETVAKMRRAWILRKQKIGEAKNSS